MSYYYEADTYELKAKLSKYLRALIKKRVLKFGENLSAQQ